MSRFFSPLRGADRERGLARTHLLLVLLLVIVGAAVYLYLFTDIIRPRPESGQAPAPVAQVKKPMPQKPGEAAQGGMSSAKTVAVAPAPAAPPAKGQQPPAAAPQGKSSVPPVPTTQAAAKGKDAAAKVQPPPAKTAAAQPPQKTTPAAGTPEKAAIKATAPVKEPAAAKKPAVASKEAEKAPATVQAAPRYLLVVGDYSSEVLLREAKAKVAKTGLKPSVEKVKSHPVAMYRLLVGSYGDKEGADGAVQRVKAAGASGFMLKEGDQYAVYAGSFQDAKRAASERKKLEDGGILTVSRKSSVSLPGFRLTAGRYDSIEEAQKSQKKLAKAGLAPRIITLGKK